MQQVESFFQPMQYSEGSMGLPVDLSASEFNGQVSSTDEYAFNFLQYLENQPGMNADDDLFTDSELDPSGYLESEKSPSSETFETFSSLPSGTSDWTNGGAFTSVNSMEAFSFPKAAAISGSQLHNDAFSLRILGVPRKSRVETQLKMCIQLVNSKGMTSTGHPWKNVVLPPHLIAPTKRPLKKQAAAVKLENGVYLTLECGVVCSSNPSKKVVRCFGCIQRERKLLQRKKNKEGDCGDEQQELSIDEEQKKIIQFYCDSKVDFSYGEAIIPTRITCYCRHHDEKVGFKIWVALRDGRNEVVASGLSDEILITDDHKSKATAVQSTGIKRQRVDTKEDPSPPPPDHGPVIEKVIPTEGPLTGGVEITILGKEFLPGLSCVFGANQSAKTDFWGPQTLVCVLPPSALPGTVPVTFSSVRGYADAPVVFTYKDETDRLLMELALQVVGMKLTGKIDDARKIAMQIVNNNQDTFKDALKGPTQRMSASETVNHVLAKVLVLDTPHLANINVRNRAGTTLLMLACIQGCHALVNLLVRNGADVNLVDANGYSALHHCALLGYQGMSRLLLDAGAKSDLKNLRGQTAVDVARERQDLPTAETISAHRRSQGEAPNKSLVVDVPRGPAGASLSTRTAHAHLASSDSSVQTQIGDLGGAGVGTQMQVEEHPSEPIVQKHHVSPSQLEKGSIPSGARAFLSNFSRAFLLIGFVAIIGTVLVLSTGAFNSGSGSTPVSPDDRVSNSPPGGVTLPDTVRKDSDSPPNLTPPYEVGEPTPSMKYQRRRDLTSPGIVLYLLLLVVATIGGCTTWKQYSRRRRVAKCRGLAFFIALLALLSYLFSLHSQ